MAALLRQELVCHRESQCGFHHDHDHIYYTTYAIDQHRVVELVKDPLSRS